ncbi:MAG: hypothetical protein RLZZ158_456 [Cyanobacteriota bacterium]|jgi:hypothetical protein
MNSESTGPASSSPLNQRSHCFAFEAEFSSNLRCIPMAVRRKLDLCGRKLRLQHWLELPEAERTTLLRWGDGPEDLSKLAERLGAITTPLAPASNESWQQLGTVPAPLGKACRQINCHPPSLPQWQHLEELERFALVKLSHPGHEHRNLPAALAEILGRLDAARDPLADR